MRKTILASALLASFVAAPTVSFAEDAERELVRPLGAGQDGVDLAAEVATKFRRIRIGLDAKFADRFGSQRSRSGAARRAGAFRRRRRSRELRRRLACRIEL